MNFLNSNISSILILIFIIVFGVIIRFYQLGEVPLGLNNDEASIGYNAYSVLKTGKDEYGVSYPVYFESYGDNKMPLYIYLTSAAITLFGVSEFSVRITSALFGSLTVIGVFFLTYMMIRRKSVALVAALLIAWNPWQFFFSRAGFEVNVATALLTFGILSFILGVTYKKWQIIFGIMSLLFFVASTYTYNATRVLAPILFLSLFIFYWKKIGVQKTLKTVVSFILLTVLLIPLFLASSPGSEAENQSALFIFSGESYAKYVEYRGYVSVLPVFLSKIFFNIPVLTVITYFKNVAGFFDVNFFFISGDTHPINGVTNHGLFYLFEMVTIPVGIFLTLRKKTKPLYFLIYWIVITVLLASLTNVIPHPTRLFSIVIPLTLFSAYGAVFLLSKVLSIPYKKFRYMTIGVICVMVLFSFVHYMVTYFVYFPIQYSKTWRAKDKELAQQLQQLEPTADKIIINKDSEFLYTSLLFYTAYDPQKVHKHAVYGKNGLLTTLEKLQKYEFREINWDQDRGLTNTIIVSSKDIPEDEKLIKVFKYPTKPVVMYVNGTNTKIDVTDTAYGIFKAN